MILFQRRGGYHPVVKSDDLIPHGAQVQSHRVRDAVVVLYQQDSIGSHKESLRSTVHCTIDWREKVYRNIIVKTIAD